MKANAPEKIYVDSKAIGDDISTTVHTKRQDYPTCTEYIRTDAFIDKAVLWMKRKSAIRYHLSEEMVEDFKKYMKGE